MSSGMNLLVTNLDKSVDNTNLMREFSRFGGLLSVDVAKDEQGCPKGFGFVNFASTADGVRALQGMDGRVIKTKAIHVHPECKEKTFSSAETFQTKWCSMTSVASEARSEYLSCAGTSETKWSSMSSVATEAKNDDDEIFDVGPLMRKLFEDQMYTDVDFCSKTENKSISAHRAVLAAKSSFFAELLFGENKEMEVPINSMSFAAFEALLKYIYTDNISFESDQLVFEILVGAATFKLHSLVEFCESYLESIGLSEANVCTMLQLSTEADAFLMKDRCITYIEENAAKVIRSENFKQSILSTVQSIVELPFLHLTETELLHAVMDWIDRHISASEKHKVTQSLLSSIRLLLLTPQELSRVMQKYPNHLKPDDGLKILMYLNNHRSVKDLPKWCNRNTFRRCTSSLSNKSKEKQRKKVSKIAIPLQTAAEEEEEEDLKELASLLQLTCISGYYRITAIKFKFSEIPDTNINDTVIALKVRVLPSKFVLSENILLHSKDQDLFFPKPIEVRSSDVVYIEAKMRGFHSCRFLCFNENDNKIQDKKFTCRVSGKPNHNRFFFISEVVYNQRPLYGFRQWRKKV